MELVGISVQAASKQAAPMDGFDPPSLGWANGRSKLMPASQSSYTREGKKRMARKVGRNLFDPSTFFSNDSTYIASCTTRNFYSFLASFFSGRSNFGTHPAKQVAFFFLTVLFNPFLQSKKDRRTGRGFSHTGGGVVLSAPFLRYINLFMSASICVPRDIRAINILLLLASSFKQSQRFRDVINSPPIPVQYMSHLRIENNKSPQK